MFVLAKRNESMRHQRRRMILQPLRLDMYCWGGAGRDSKRHSTAQRTAAQGAELRTLDIACDSIACRATLNMAAHVHTHP